ncbi:L-2-hydroxyglutarate oxidase [Rhodopirellula sp. JC740]|uniref:L-2-hydroxyglutarate oxidase n=1 Tax=Rhodopirellula halodulae TaxID=2894198 RepID=A0ABS8NE24_9BACT|nr:L-2-hydroxyglutarate oxidase [Rhodopirellula sp. JC740]MCC9641793.1 L-2-hydroxyglutarate oxidase [Rhodopirellula sp. JC740]
MCYTASESCDLAVIGGGVVGLATAMTWLRRFPGQRVVVLETEDSVAAHQSGHNSGVIHSGIYYQPGSEKALLCREGKAKLESYCTENAIPWEKCGKVVVATDESEVESLERIISRAAANEVPFRRITTDELHQIEPSVAGVEAIAVPGTGIVDYRQVALAYRNHIQQAGGIVRLNCPVRTVFTEDREVRLDCIDHANRSERWECRAKSVIACAGLHSDELFHQTRRQVEQGIGRGGVNGSNDVRIVPFRGEYYMLRPEKRGLCRHLIYPVPDPSFPFLGVHFTRMIDGNVECGPNAVLALAREGYRWRDIDVRYLQRTLGYRGFLRLAQKHWRKGLGEMHRSLRKSAFTHALQRLIPELQSSDLIPARAGVRAQAVRDNGELVDDFLFESTPHMTHVLNAPSPAATASLAIAERVVEKHCRDSGVSV